MFLEGSCDLLVLRLLEFPASCCGYTLRHQREENLLEAADELVLFDLSGLDDVIV
jgi:hypothetical protein